jgi:hypothetical protein
MVKYPKVGDEVLVWDSLIMQANGNPGPYRCEVKRVVHMGSTIGLMVVVQYRSLGGASVNETMVSNRQLQRIPRNYIDHVGQRY